jgi:peptidoglycan lytic transglycosylase
LKYAREHRRLIRCVTLSGAFACVLLATKDVTPATAHPHSAHAKHGRDHSTGYKHAGDEVVLPAPPLQRVDANEATPPPIVGFLQRLMKGIASVYSGGRTASGEHMNAGAMTAAHRTLPFGTNVTVVNNHNGRSAVVRINDRGPFKRGRIIDLSPAAARAIGVSGLAPVSLTVGVAADAAHGREAE